MRVHILLFSSPFFRGNIVLGGEIQRGSIIHDTGYSAKAQCTGKQSHVSTTAVLVSTRTIYKGGYRQKIAQQNQPTSNVPFHNHTNSNQNRSTTQKYLDSSNGLVNEPCSSQNSPRENSSPSTQANARAAESASTHAHSKRVKRFGIL